MQVGLHYSRVSGRPASSIPAPLHHLIDQAVVTALLGVHKAVTLGVTLDNLERLTGVLGHQADSGVRE